MPDIVMMVVGRTEKVVVGEIRPDPMLQEDTLSVSSSTSLQDPREVIAEMSVIKISCGQPGAAVTKTGKLSWTYKMET